MPKIKHILLAFTLLIFSNSFGQKKNFQNINIPGIAEINNDTGISKYEVSILNWLTFIACNNFDDRLFPDTTKMSQLAKTIFTDFRRKDNFEYIEPLKNRINDYNYLNYNNKLIQPIKKNFNRLLASDTMFFSLKIPITGITYEQAVSYCMWIQKQTNEKLRTNFKVFLPSLAFYNELIQNKDSVNVEKCPMFNFKDCHCLKTKTNEKFITNGKCLYMVDSYWPNELGIYNLQGNVAEMTDTKGIAIGGSFRHYAFETLKDNQQTYTNVEDWVGFRYMITTK